MEIWVAIILLAVGFVCLVKGADWFVDGAAGIADRRTIPAILKEDSCELVAVMDREPAVAEAIGKKYGVPYFSEEAETIPT